MAVLKDPMLPVESGDADLRSGLSETRGSSPPCRATPASSCGRSVASGNGSASSIRLPAGSSSRICFPPLPVTISFPNAPRLAQPRPRPPDHRPRAGSGSIPPTRASGRRASPRRRRRSPARSATAAALPGTAPQTWGRAQPRQNPEVGERGRGLDVVGDVANAHRAHIRHPLEPEAPNPGLAPAEVKSRGGRWGSLDLRATCGSWPKSRSRVSW